MNYNNAVISVALTGAITTQAESAALPITPEEIAADVVACAKAGAAIAHIHVRAQDGSGTMDTARFIETVAAVRDAIRAAGVDIILNLTTSGAVCPDDELRMAHLKALRPEMCSYDAGSLNWAGEEVFINSPEFLAKLGRCTLEYQIKPEIEVFDTAMIKNAVRNAKRGLLDEPLHFQFVLGTYGGMAGTVENLIFLRSMLPENATYSVSGIGSASVPIMMAALAMGADGIRVGLEDNVFMSKGVPATNVLQVERAVQLVQLSGRKPATAEETRSLLHFPRRGSKVQ